MNVKHMTDIALEYVIRDINAAISANPENPKVELYLAQRKALRTEEVLRHTKRVLRNMNKRNMDRMQIPVRIRKHYEGVRYVPTAQDRRSNFVFMNAHSAQWQLGHIALRSN